MAPFGSPRPAARTGHVGWLAVAAQRYTLDYTKGLFPWGEGGAISDAALLATGRLDASLSDHKLWDAAPVLPVLEACGFRLYRWPDLAAPPCALIDLFDAGFSGHDGLWLVCRDRGQAAALAGAIRRAGPPPALDGGPRRAPPHPAPSTIPRVGAPVARAWPNPHGLRGTADPAASIGAVRGRSGGAADG